MFLALLLLFLILLLGGIGFAIHALWVIAAVVFFVWLIGFFVRGAERSWYRW